MKPVLLVTSEIPPDRVAPFQALNARTPIVCYRCEFSPAAHAPHHVGGSA